MGYTTEFEGQFDCYRAEREQIGAFLMRAYPEDRGVMSVFADWLEEHGDPRGEQVRVFLAGQTEDTAPFWRLFGLTAEHAAYLTKFNETRRMTRDPATVARMSDPIREAVGLPIGPGGAYFVGGSGFRGQGDDESVLDFNTPPDGQPGLWCGWRPSDDRTVIVWDEVEKFYHYVEWLEYLIAHFLGPWGYILNGEMRWQGEDIEDCGTLTVLHNRVVATPTLDDSEAG